MLVKGVSYEDPPVRYRGERVLQLAKRLLSSSIRMPDFIDERFAASLYYMLFLPYPVIEKPAGNDSKLLKQYLVMSTLRLSPKLSEVRKHTIADLTTSLAASAVLLEALARELSKSQARESGGQGGHGGRERGRSQEVSEEEVRRSVEKALEAAHDVAKQAKEIASFAMTFSAGSASMLSLEDSVQDVINLARNTDVRAVLEALKTIEEESIYFRVRRMRSVRGELDGYEKGADLERIVPSELALPEEYLYVKYAERSLLLYRKTIGEDYGPFYVLLDKSGSMMGMKILWAKAVALALAQRAARERREFYLRFFDSVPYPPLHIPRRVRGKDVAKLLEYVARVRANGGTDITRAIMVALEDIRNSNARNKPSDIVLITDGEDRVSVEMLRSSLAAAKARLYTVMIYGNNPDLRRISESYMVATKLNREEALRVLAVSPGGRSV